MSDATLIGIEEIALDQIKVGDRARPVSDKAVESLMASIVEVGHMADEIHVRKMPGSAALPYRLIAGGHRLEAHKRLEKPTIRAKVWKCGARWARLWEIDENLFHAELDVLEMATFLAQRKQVYLELHPEKRQGVAGGKARQNSATDIVSVAQTIAEKRQISERHVYRLLAAGETITSDEQRWLRTAPKPPTLADLVALAKESDAGERSQSIAAFHNGEAKSLKAALQARVKAPPKSRVSQTHGRILQAWDAAPMAAKRAFVADRADELIRLLTQLQDSSDEAPEGEVVPFTSRRGQ